MLPAPTFCPVAFDSMPMSCSVLRDLQVQTALNGLSALQLQYRFTASRVMLALEQLAVYCLQIRDMPGVYGLNKRSAHRYCGALASSLMTLSTTSPGPHLTVICPAHSELPTTTHATPKFCLLFAATQMQTKPPTPLPESSNPYCKTRNLRDPTSSFQPLTLQSPNSPFHRPNHHLLDEFPPSSGLNPPSGTAFSPRLASRPPTTASEPPPPPALSPSMATD